MTIAATWSALDRCLAVSPDRPAATQARAALRSQDVDWLRLIALANADFVGPALATAAQRLGVFSDMPDDVRSYLCLLLDNNKQRNARIRQQCLTIGEGLQMHGLDAVLLKGAAWLFDAGGDSAADRMMRDIDLLVSRTRLDRAGAVLVAAGYQDMSATFLEVGHFHDAPFVSGAEEASVELHRDLAHRADLLPSEEVLGAATRLGPGLLLPTRAHRILHNVIHAQIENGDWFSGAASLRDLLDLARLVTEAERDFDWPALARSARGRGLYPILSGALHTAHRIFGSPVPPAFERSLRGRWHARRCLLQRRLPALRRTFEAWGQLVRAVAWDRDAYGLGVTTRVSLLAQIKVNTRRAQRIGKLLRGAWR